MSAIAGLLEVMIEREETGEEEERAADEAKQWLQENGGKGIPHEDVLADFGSQRERLPRMGEEHAEPRLSARFNHIPKPIKWTPPTCD